MHKPRKRFGQHFLHDRNIVAKLLAAVAPRPGEHFVEIGPGEGALTLPLLDRAGSLDVVEIDRDLLPPLAEAAGGRGALRVHEADALRFDFAALPAPLRVVGNLPYNISSPLLFRLIGFAERITDMHFMLQREVVERLAAGPGSADYGRLSVMVQLHCRVEKLFRVKAAAFRPPPKVESAVVRLTPHEQAPVAVGDARAFEAVVRAAFGQRRKTLRNTLKPLLSATAIEAAGVDPGARAETLTLAEFAALARRVSRDDTL